jgi:hypothetical protein
VEMAGNFLERPLYSSSASVCSFCSMTIYSLSRYDGLETEHKSLYYVFVWVDVNLCTVTVIELIVFSYNEVTVQWGAV